ncbi:MAG TPA: prepilin-type N-terminal cleavage/methylation domain-containing protein [Elusimicrobiales bacterium]|nr:prepilin-type N-terminal cleavage/methylation domain-containing protein [Elusimicrobiales bacterium]
MVSRRGVTLMEMMIVAGIITTLFAISAPLLLQANRQFIMIRTKLALQQEARGTMYILTRSLRQAKADSIVISRADASQPFYSKITYTTEQSSTTLLSNTFTFQQEGSNLCQILGGQRRVLSTSLSYLAFTFPRSDDMSMISVAITLQKNIYEGKTKALHMASEKVHVMN